MTDVIFINSPIILKRRGIKSTSSEGDEKSNPPLGILYIAACLEKEGFSCKLLDITAKGLTLEDVLETVEKESPSVVGISTLTPGIRSTVQLGQALREKFGDKIKIAVGGAHLNSDPEFVNRYKYFDFTIIGEAEITFVKVMKDIKSGKPVQKIIEGEQVEDLNTLPLPARHLVDINDYVRDEQRGIVKPATTIMSSRGCPFKCIFCSRPPLKRTVRYRSPENIMKEILSTYDQCDGMYSFMDETLTLNKKNFLAFCELIDKSGKKITSNGMTRAGTIDPDVAAAMYRSGFRDIFIGVESGNERIRNEVIKKNVTNKQIIDAIKILKKNKIHTNIFLMLGFPGETMVEINDTVKFPRISGVDIFGIHITVPLPGADLFEYAIEKKMIPADLIDKYARGDLGVGFTNNWPMFIPEGLTLDQLVNAKKRAYRSFYLSPTWMVKRIKTYFLHPKKIVEDILLIKVALRVFLTGKTKGSMS